MSHRPSPLLSFAVGSLVIGAVAAAMLLLPSAPTRAATAFAPTFSDAFMAHWSDGNAELSGYTLTQPRYGELRQGRAVVVFVKQPFDERTRTKPTEVDDDTFTVMKLNHVQDFQTGLYDYNLLTSAFVGLAPSGGRPAGAPAKVSFSGQEWCGHTYAQLLFDAGRARLASHSYFDGEGDRLGTLEHHPDGLVEDTLWLWARGMTGPALPPGGTAQVPLLPSLKRSRLQHRPLDWTSAVASRSATTESITVPAGTFVVERRSVQTSAGLRLTFFVEHDFPHRVIRFEGSDGEEAELLGTTRQPYWSLHDNGHERYLKELGFDTP